MPNYLSAQVTAHTEKNIGNKLFNRHLFISLPKIQDKVLIKKRFFMVLSFIIFNLINN